MSKKYGITGFALKWIAIVSMALDHTGAILFPEQIWFRIIGRLAFPIFCFLLVEGFKNTSNVTKYGIRLIAFAILSEIPFDLAFSGKLFDWSHQNIFLTLVLGLMFMILMRYEARKWLLILLSAVIFLAAYFCRVDYSLCGVLMVGFMYYFSYNKKYELGALALSNILCWGFTIQAVASCAVVPLALYNGKRGPKMKYFFYIFYPAHLLLLYLIASRIKGQWR